MRLWNTSRDQQQIGHYLPVPAMIYRTRDGSERGVRRRVPMILVVDDHPASCDVLKRLLSGRGLEAVGAHNAQDAAAILKQLTPSVIVLDDMMPDETGLELLREIRRDPKTARGAVILYTAVFFFLGGGGGPRSG